MKKVFLFVNLGSPDSAAVKDVRPYLKEFLMDPYVIDVAWWKRFLLVHGIIVPRRVKNSAHAYQQIWTEKGSPLINYTKNLVKKIDIIFKENDTQARAFFAMRYGKPSIYSVVSEIKEKFSDLQELILVPLYPQRADSTTTTVREEFLRSLKKVSFFPTWKIVPEFFSEDFYLDAFVHNAQALQYETFDHFVFSFHGLPERHVKKVCPEICLKKENCCEKLHSENKICYRAQCFETARLIAQKLGISSTHYDVCFQSRLGKDPWIKPYSDEVFERLKLRKDIQDLLVFSPAFVADCLETLEELGIQAAKDFEPKNLKLVPSLNDDDRVAQGFVKFLEPYLGNQPAYSLATP